MKSLGAAMILLWGLVVVAAQRVSSTQPNYDDELRDMIIELKGELRYSKEQLNDVETGLRTQLQAVETRLRASEKTVEEQKLVIKELMRDREASRVSFSAALGRGTYGEFDTLTTLVFKDILTNVGSAYDVNTGVFTAPVRGVYHFVLFVFGDASPSTRTGASLHHNNKPVVTAYDHQQDAYHVTPANGASLLLEVGDVVQVKLWHKSKVRDTTDRQTTFSGHLLFTM